MPISLKSASGGGAVPVGGTVMFPDFFENVVVQDGDTYLRSGYVETDETKFDTTFFNFPFIDKAKSTIGINFSGAQQYSNAKFVRGKFWVIGSNPSANIYSSVDGINYSLVSLPDNTSDHSIRDIVDSGTTLLLVGGSTKHWTSTDGGATWVSRTSPFSSNSTPNSGFMYSACYFGGYFYAWGPTSGTTNAIKRSADGINWTDVRTDNVGAWGVILNSSSRLLIRGVDTDDNRKIFTSTNGTTWSEVYEFPSTDSINLHGFLNGKFVISGFRSGPPNQSYFATSTDGTSWDFIFTTNEPVLTNTAWPNTVRYHDGYYFGTSPDVNTISVSRNLSKWVKRQITSVGNGIKPSNSAYGDGKLVFIDFQQYDYAVLCVENFSGTQYYAGAPNYFEQGSVVQYMRIK